MREKGVGLEHHADITLLNGTMRDILTINKNLPSDGFSSPATRRSTVVLPQPDGPSNVTISPCGMARLMLSITVLLPNRLVTLRSSTKCFCVMVALRYAWFLALEREIRASPISQSK
jgi:hypothetical protein